MGSLDVMFALFVVGYLVGVWTACMVLRQSQKDYEEGSRREPAVVPIGSWPSK